MRPRRSGCGRDDVDVGGDDAFVEAHHHGQRLPGLVGDRDLDAPVNLSNVGFKKSYFVFDCSRGKRVRHLSLV